MITLIPLSCDFCKKEFNKTLTQHKQCVQRGRKNCFCSARCASDFLKITKSIKISCKQCTKEFVRQKRLINKSKNNFCSQSCWGRYHNAHKTHGYSRSKLEKFLEQQLIIIYPYLEFKYNNVDMINAELDIYIPSLKLAFELNGIFHYEPIYGEEKLKSIQNNDNRKFQACLEKGIELCILDTSKQRKFTEQSSIVYLDIIKSVIDLKLAVTGNDPVTNSL